MISLLDQVYSAPGGLPLRFDYFQPDNATPAPLVICIHGGGWISGEKEGMRDVAVMLVENGYAAACPQYRLAPLHPFPAAVQDMQEFVRYCRSENHLLPIETNKIVSLGNSAGGHLAGMLGLTDAGGDISSRVNYVIDICGISDVTNPQVQHYPISWSFLEQFMQVPFEGNEDRYREASPLSHVDSNAPPFFIAHGDVDDVVPISQSEALAKALDANGTTYEFHRICGEGHSFSYEGWTMIADRFIQFLDKHLKNA